MALDNANFIAELSITDPPGSDPLSQGDDQIRTTKRAVQQSFPNIDKAVTLTADQMNLAAIKNEANVFTVTDNEFTETLIINAGGGTQFRDLNFRVSGTESWSLTVDSFASNRFSLGRFDVLGAFVDNVFTVDNGTGVLNHTIMPTIQLAPIWVVGEIRMFAIAATPGNNWFVADGLNGTVNLEGRFLQANNAFDTDFTNRDAELEATADAGVSGSTAISAAQMPVHTHRIWSGNQSGVTDTTFAHAATQTVAGANRGNTGPAFALNNSIGQQILEDSGGGTGHNHTTPATNVSVDDPGFVNAVRPLSRTVAMFQYVP